MSLVRAAQRGLTLIEVMVALSVFAVLGVLTWRATDHLVGARQHIGAELERWRAISLTAHRIGGELQQIAPAPGTLQFTPAPNATAQDTAHMLSFTVLQGYDGLPARGGFVLVERRLEWWLWSHDHATVPPERITLLDDVDAVRWRFLHADGWTDTWPPDQAAARVLPAAISIELELPDAGTLVRVFALR
ncbi:type II secretion system protein GspJ [Thauera linaloolentis]|uniref:Type II secretion system protein J n=1 Tax=Thauera linaloolentis (strain DSM 12138 / JCM 21573 / CCUG 41526 / CIP 105981 / IAM 15112 / NBRC 102519 / 47Lol) TaxID=1123367 RepID=N6YNF4_THAL4|nr:type II secretion system protein GspJ [Thauera linaloolentis]ENO83718.1 general secretory pathway protein J [Thauera linaloolentis 47Lol = DSM 12138]MCM8565866.1 prepilin-type N-terminal cleavage/methylation domain-containing protein [Thauera linaloolentis]